jgi:hypothetical protein
VFQASAFRVVIQVILHTVTCIQQLDEDEGWRNIPVRLRRKHLFCKDAGCSQWECRWRRDFTVSATTKLLTTDNVFSFNGSIVAMLTNHKQLILRLSLFIQMGSLALSNSDQQSRRCVALRARANRCLLEVSSRTRKKTMPGLGGVCHPRPPMWTWAGSPPATGSITVRLI